MADMHGLASRLRQIANLDYKEFSAAIDVDLDVVLRRLDEVVTTHLADEVPNVSEPALLAGVLANAPKVAVDSLRTDAPEN